MYEFPPQPEAVLFERTERSSITLKTLKKLKYPEKFTKT